MAMIQQILNLLHFVRSAGVRQSAGPETVFRILNAGIVVIAKGAATMLLKAITAHIIIALNVRI